MIKVVIRVGSAVFVCTTCAIIETDSTLHTDPETEFLFTVTKGQQPPILFLPWSDVVFSLQAHLFCEVWGC